ncbi:MAG: peptide-methionine (R)-S-oxide reductase MsrB [Rhodanobacteraceae bacterium]
MNRRHFIHHAAAGLAGFGLLTTLGCSKAISGGSDGRPSASDPKWQLSDAEWRQRLSPARYRILRQAGTEPSGSSALNDEQRKGIYHCAGCDLPLYSSETKFHSGTGWPSFYAPLPDAVAMQKDRSFFMTRTEVHCRRCAGHLGHVFDDGPKPTGLRYCMNGLALTFAPARA